MENTSLFLLAPAGWGKTTLIFKLFERNNWNVLMVLPLKSLQQEIQKKIEKYEKNKVFFKALTAEKAPKFLEGLNPNIKTNLIIVFDEIHLWNNWGSSFRHRLWECLYLILNEGYPLLGLTATLRAEYQDEWQRLFEMGGYKHQVLNLGNGEVENVPTTELNYYGLNKKIFHRRFLYEADKGESCLIFCQYKQEVFNLTKYLKNEKFKVMSCVGGESLKFMNEFETKDKPQIIVATSALSHGVNLGEIKNVFISYEVKQWDILLQMKARGGRLGGGYNFFYFEREKKGFLRKFYLSLFDRYLSLFYA